MARACLILTRRSERDSSFERQERVGLQLVVDERHDRGERLADALPRERDPDAATEGLHIVVRSQQHREQVAE